MRHVDVRTGAYRDSVRLMQVSKVVDGRPEVRSVLVAMATDLNLELLAGMGFEPPTATANDLVVAVEVAGPEALDGVLAAVDAELATVARPTGFGGVPPPRTVGSAAGRLDATLTCVSTPGPYVFADAVDALEAGTSVLIFSDNVPVEQEVALKELAAARGLLVMGPDCGTAVIGGVGLGFANVVRPGQVGLVAASGTGAQQVMALLAAAEVGISHCLGVGGRDLSSAVAGRSTVAALDALDTDPATELIVLVSKPPAPEVADAVRAHAAGLATPVVFALLGPGLPDLTAVTADALGRLGVGVPDPWPNWLPDAPAAGLPDAPSAGLADALSGAPVAGRSGALRGLFSGGTLCDEAMVIAAETLGPVGSNIPLRPEWTVGVSAHTFVDFGDDELTRGRPHPMIDGSLRIDRLAAEVDDPSCGVVLLDVVLGHAAHPDPADELAPAVATAVASGVGVVVSLVGTVDDPQGLARQAAALRDAGASVYLSNAQAARAAVGMVTP